LFHNDTKSGKRQPLKFRKYILDRRDNSQTAIQVSDCRSAMNDDYGEARVDGAYHRQVQQDPEISRRDGLQNAARQIVGRVKIDPPLWRKYHRAICIA